MSTTHTGTPFSPKFNSLWFYLIAVLSLSGCVRSDNGSDSRSDQSNPRYVRDQVILDFPKIHSVGEVLVYDGEQLRSLGAARGGKVLAKGSKICIKLDYMPEPVDLSFLRKIPKDCLWKIEAHDTELQDSSLVEFMPFTELRELDLSGTQVTDSGLVHLSTLTKLSSLSLQHDAITGDGLKYLPLSLRSLNLDRSCFDDRGVSALLRLHNLNELRLRECRVSDRILPSICSLKSLLLLNLAFNNLSWSKLSQLSSIPFLSHLYLDGIEIKKRGELEFLARMRVNTLSLSECSCRDADLQTIGKIKSLMVLNLARSNDLTDSGICFLSHLRSLKHLTLSNNLHLKAANVGQWGPFPELQTLSLSDTATGDECLEQLSRSFPKLRHLWLEHTLISDDGVAKLTRCKEISLLNLQSNLRLTDACLESLQSMPNLEELNIATTNITSVADFQKSRPRCKLRL